MALPVIGKRLVNVTFVVPRNAPVAVIDSVQWSDFQSSGVVCKGSIIVLLFMPTAGALPESPIVHRIEVQLF